MRNIMIQEQVNNIIHDYSYFKLYGLVFFYFLFLYFVVAPVFLWFCKFLNRKSIVHKIVEKEVTRKQIGYEMMHSLKSIFIFGFSAFPIVYLIRIGAITLLPDTLLNVILGVSLLTIWNEVHFFVVHRIMHLSFFMRHVHFVHHKSKTPTVYSVYSFHWFEALLLSTIPVTITPFVPFAPTAIFLYPLASVLLNYSGHCNYRFGNGIGPSWQLFGTHHNEHHSKGRKNYGFASNLLDKLHAKLSKKRIVP
ncbi:sterol desaturase family protein [Bacteroidales bacterium AH-315-I05]|nr:sterol desaturase family protein [Bacteroidales bacterium AH-315-I05]